MDTDGRTFGSLCKEEAQAESLRIVPFDWLPWLNVADPVTACAPDVQATTINDALSAMTRHRKEINDANVSGARCEGTEEISKNLLQVLFVEACLGCTMLSSEGVVS